MGNERDDVMFPYNRQVNKEVLQLALGMGLLALCCGTVSFLQITEPTHSAQGLTDASWAIEADYGDLRDTTCCISMAVISLLLIIIFIVTLSKYIARRRSGELSIDRRGKAGHVIFYAMVVFGVCMTTLIFLLGYGFEGNAVNNIFFIVCATPIGAFFILKSIAESQINEDEKTRKLFNTGLISYIAALLITLAGTYSSSAVIGAICVTSWIISAVAIFGVGLRASFCERGNKWGAVFRDLDTVVCCSVLVVVLLYSLSIAGGSLIKADPRLYKVTAPVGEDHLNVVVVNYGGWPAEGELVLYGRLNGTDTEIARISRIEGYGHWEVIAHLEQVNASEVHLFYNGNEIDWSIIWTQPTECDVIYPILIIGLCAAAIKIRKRRKDSID